MTLFSKFLSNLAQSLYGLGTIPFLFSLSSFALEGPDCTKDSAYPEVSKTELMTIVQNGSALIIDVNSNEEYSKTHVPGAVHFENEASLAQTLPRDKTKMIVTYCGGPKCGAWKKAAFKACKMGYTNVAHYKGGISEWNHYFPASTTSK